MQKSQAEDEEGTMATPSGDISRRHLSHLSSSLSLSLIWVHKKGWNAGLWTLVTALTYPNGSLWLPSPIPLKESSKQTILIEQLFLFSVTVFSVVKYTICVIVYCDVVNVQPCFNFLNEIIK